MTPNDIKINTGIVNIGYKPKDTFFTEKEESLYRLKNKINDYLESIEQRIIVVVDDIDRLTDDETETFFRLIKGVADFKNITYLLLYDKQVVSKSLEKHKQENGEKYLDKIVQYSLSVPKTYTSKLNQLLFDELNQILDSNGVRIINQEKWQRVIPLLPDYIKNIRDINRIVSVMSFEYPQIHEDVNFVDFFLISLIKIQKSELYNLIKDKKGEIFGTFDFGDSKDIRRDKSLKYFDEHLTKYKEFKPVLEIMFPILDSLSDYYHYKHHEEKPISSSQYVESYFTFSVSENGLSHGQYMKIFDVLIKDNYEDFKNIIMGFNTREQLLLFKEMFRDISLSTLESEGIIKNIVFNLLLISIELDEGKDIVDFSPMSYFHLLAFDVFQKADNKDEILKELYLTTEYNVAYKVLIDFYWRIKEYNLKHSPELNVSPNVMQQLIDKLKSTISAVTLEVMIKSSFRPEFKKFSFYSLVWSYEILDMDLSILSKELMDRIFKTKEDFFQILELFKYRQITSSWSGDMMDKSKIGKLLEISEIEKYLEALDIEMLNDEEKYLIEVWNRKDYF